MTADKVVVPLWRRAVYTVGSCVVAWHVGFAGAVLIGGGPLALWTIWNRRGPSPCSHCGASRPHCLARRDEGKA